MAGISLSGFNGIDFNSIINLTMQSESQPLQDLQTRQTGLKSQDTALVSMAGILASLKSAATSLTSTTAFSNVAATSSDTTVATVSLGDGGIPGQYDLVVDHLAKGQVTSSTNGFSAITDAAATGGQISFTIGGTTTDPITITGSTSLSDLKGLINDQDSGVVASIVNDGTNYKLVISSRETGVDNGFKINNTLTGTGAVAFAADQDATHSNKQYAINASFTMNGLTIGSDSNTVTDAVPGVTISLAKAGSTSIVVKQDFSSIKDNLQTLVTQYNKLRQFYTAQQAQGPLANNSVMREALNDVKSVLLESNSNGGRYHYLSEIGLELTSTGDLKLNQTKLTTALNSYPDDLQKLFQGSNSDGVLDDMIDTLKNLDETAGMIKLTRDGITSSTKSLQRQIDAQQLRLDMRRKQLVQMYSQADQAMSQLNNLKSSLPTSSLF